MGEVRWYTMFEQSDMGKRRGQRTGYLFDKGRYWYLQFWEDSRDEIDPKTGKPKRKRHTRQIADRKGPEKKNRREAERIAYDTVLSKLDQREMRAGSNVTLQQFVDRRWRPDRLEHLSAKGKQSYETQLRNHILPALGSKALRDIGLAHIQDLINQRAQWVSPKTKKKLQPESLQQIVATLKAVFNHAKRMDCITILPTDGVRLPKSRPKEKMALSWDQVETIANALPEPISTLVVFLAWTGLRIGEACGLRWRDVDLDTLTVHVRENFVMSQYQDLKTRKSSRDVPIPMELAKRLESLASLHVRQSDGWTRHGEISVFANTTRSAPIDAHNVANRILKPLVKTLGLPWVSWHTFRRTTATLMDQQGLSMAERQKVMGHTTVAMMQHYTRPELENIRKKMAGMASKAVN